VLSRARCALCRFCAGSPWCRGDRVPKESRLPGTPVQRAYEFESRDGIDVVSVVNQGAAFLGISRSSRQHPILAARLPELLFSSLVRPSLRRPSSREACTTQLRMAPAEGSKLPGSSSGVGRTRVSVDWKAIRQGPPLSHAATRCNRASV
jgi:hypothetical protein